MDWIAAEDTRRASILLQSHDISSRLISHHAHNEHRGLAGLLARLEAGESGALITDAGTPGVSDPGFLLARAAREAGIDVVVLPGPSAVLTALISSGLPPEPFVFLGYVPSTSGKRAKFLETVSEEPRTVVLFEVPHRIHRTLEAAVPLWGDRSIALLREMTKLHEECVRGTAAEVLGVLPEKARGEMVIVIGPLSKKELKARGR